MCSASCIIHLHRSGLASAAPDPRPCPLYLLQWLVERYIRPLTVTTSWRPSFCFLGSPSRAAHRCPYHERERLSFSRFRVSSHRGAATLSFSPRFLVARHYSPAAHIHPFSSHIPFLLSFPSVNFACQKVLCSGEGKEKEAKKGHVSKRSNNVT